MDNNRYGMRGVSSAKEDVREAIKNLDKGLYPKAFCKIIPDVLSQVRRTLHNNACRRSEARSQASHTRIGAKQVIWACGKESPKIPFIMNIDDLLCVGATDNILLSSTIGRNKLLVPGEVISAVINGTQELIDELGRRGVNIVSTGGETADVGDLVRTIIVDSTVTYRVGVKT